MLIIYIKKGFIFLLLFRCLPLFGQTVTLDSTFSDDGKETIGVGSHGAKAYAIAVQPDGKILLAGQASITNYTDFALIRLNPDGSLDSLFGTDGKVITSMGVTSDNAHAVAVQENGKILIAGTAADGFFNRNFALIRYENDGTFDTSFGVNGKVVTPIGLGDDEGTDIQIQETDGKIFVAGYSNNGSNNDFAIVRYHPDGTIDSLFGVDGKVTTAVGIGDDRSYQMAIQSDGKILLAGESIQNSFYDFAVTRYLSNGSLDPAFGKNADGIVTIAPAFQNESGVTIVIQESDNKIVIGGYTAPGLGTTSFAMVRLNTDGLVDSTFGTNGIVNTYLGIDCFGRSLSIQHDGSILLAGQIGLGSSADFGLARYDSHGKLDTKFGINGIVITDFDGYRDAAFSMVAQSDGKILLAGESVKNLGSYTEFAIARYHPSHVVSVKDVTLQNKFTSVRPNPAKDKFTLELSLQSFQHLSIDLFDVVGNRVHSFCTHCRFEEGKNELNFTLPENIISGIYFLVISGKGMKDIVKLVLR